MPQLSSDDQIPPSSVLPLAANLPIHDALVPPDEGADHETDPPVDPDAWRGELHDRLNRYRARRKMRPPRYPSLALEFGQLDSLRMPDADLSPSRIFEPLSDRSLALKADASFSPTIESATEQTLRPVAPSAMPGNTGASNSHAGAKIIEFPRSAWAPPPPPPDQLAEPVADLPRILEVPETPPPLPALGGITIEAPEREEIGKRPGIDIPLQAASLPRRVAAAAIDSLIICLAAGLFGLIFWKLDAIRPPFIQAITLPLATLSVFWALYQYLLIVYSGGTPGLRAAGLRLARFDGTPTPRRLRRWRVLASYLSAISLGMGYLWAFLDEDALCWHDRITHTYLSPSREDSKSASH